MRFDHAGIACEEIEPVADTFCGVLGVDIVHEETLEQLRVSFLDLGNGYLELLEPIEPDGPIATYLNRHGPGIHHLAFETDDIETALARAKDAGITTIDDEPRPGAWGHEVAFLHPSDMGGVLVEFVEH